VKILAITKRWLRYKLPTQMQRHVQTPLCIGQKQKWFPLLLTGADNKICLTANKKPKFNGWHWVDYRYPLKQVVYFKRDISRKVLTEFEPPIINLCLSTHR